MQRSNGFTIIELLVVISILAILAALAIPSYLDFFEKGRLRGAAEAVYEQLQYARAQALKKSTPIIVDFSANETTTWALGVTDKTDGCDASDVASCTIDFDNDPTTDPLPVRLSSTDFTNITMTYQVYDNNKAGPGACSTKAPNEACFEPIRGFARPPIKHLQLISSNNTYTLQVEIDAVGRIKICVPSDKEKFIGYDICD